MKQKMALIVMSAILVVMNFSSTTNAQTNDVVNSEGIKMEDIDEKEMADEEIDLVEEKEKEVEEIVNFYEDIEEEYDKVTMSNDDARLKYTGTIDDENEVSIFIKNEVYEHKEKDKAIMTATIFDGETDEILKFDAFESTDDGEPKTIMNLDYTDDLLSEDEGSYSTQGFTVDGEAFKCGMVGFLACTQYCAVWLAGTGPIGGGVCEGICNTAMVAACATSVD